MAVLASCTFSLAPLAANADDATMPPPAVDGSSDAGDDGTDAADADADAEPPCTDDLDASPTSCGACGHDCAGGACLAGQCQPYAILDDETNAYGLTADDTYLYYTLGLPAVRAADAGPDGGFLSAGSVRRVRKDSLDGGATVLAAAESSPHFIVLDAQGDLYWSSARGISTTRADGSTAAAVVCAEPMGAFELAVDTDGTLFYTVIGNGGTSTDAIRHCDPATGLVTTIAATFQPKAVALDAANVWWTSFCDPAHILANSNCDVDGGMGSVHYAPKSSANLDGGTLRATVGAGAEAILLSSADVYVTTFNEGSAYFLTASIGVGSSLSHLFPANALYSGADRLVFDPVLPQRLYMATYEGYLLAYDVGTQAVTPLPVGGSPHVVRLVADSSYLYWTTDSGNSIERLRK